MAWILQFLNNLDMGASSDPEVLPDDFVLTGRVRINFEVDLSTDMQTTIDLEAPVSLEVQAATRLRTEITLPAETNLLVGDV